MRRLPHIASVSLVLVGLAVANLRGTPPPPRPAIVLSPIERAWLAAHPVIRVGFDPDFPPFCFRAADGIAHGIDVDLLNAIGGELGIKFDLHTRATWTEVYDAASRRDLDVLSSTADIPERRALFLFTRPYVQFAVTIVTRGDGPFAVTEADLRSMRVAGARNYAPTLAFQRAFPGLHITEFDTVDKAMKAVANAEADAVVTNLANASYIIKTRGLANLKIAGVIPEVFQERLAVRSDWPEFASILDRAVGSIPPSTMTAILDRWVKVDYAAVIRWDLVRRWAIIGLLFGATIVALVMWRNISLARELAKRRALLLELEEANRRLNAANVELGRRHDEKAELMRVAAHDLRGPLAAIMLAAESSREEPAGQWLDTIENCARRMAQLIDDLLHVHAIEEGQRVFRQDHVSPDAIARQAADTFQSAAGRKQITIDTAGLHPTDEVQGDAAALRQVFENLISNAVKFSPPGTSVRVRSSLWHEGVRIEVQDQGPGVRDDERERIFSKYTCGSAKPTAGEKSTGLGLTIVREIVAASNGRVWCENVPEGGAIFVVVLPRVKASVATS